MDSQHHDATPTKPRLEPIPKMVRYEWYQTQTHVVLTLLQKHTSPDDLLVEADDRSLKVCTKLSNGEDFVLDLSLNHLIVPNSAVSKVMASKVEIRVKKVEGVQWTKLEGNELRSGCDEQQSSQPDLQHIDAVTTYPSSSLTPKDWNKIEREVLEEEKSEKPEGDAALNKLFQQIYADGSDETKKAMMKSFSESGGTVLSTNWSEVGKDKVDVKPPDGMEYRKYET